MTLADASDETIAEMLQQAELPSLLPALAYLTGDMSLVASEVRPPAQQAAVVLAPQGGLTAEQQAVARVRALAALIRFRDEGCIPAVHDSAGEARRPLLEFMTGEVDDRYLPMLAFELGVPDDVDAPTWRKSELAGDRDFTVAIIGAGMSGLAMAYRLLQAEVEFVVLERNADVGGVWLENEYPGCRLDTSNFCYSYSFMQRDDWPHQYSLGSEIQGYFHGVADKLGLRDRIRFNTEVSAAMFDEAAGQWRLTVATNGNREEILAHAVVSAVGQLNTPSFPDIPGREEFEGASFHSARWDTSVPLDERRVGVIGTGASAYQVAPSIAGSVAELTLFQRTPPWTVPTPGYHATVPAGLAWLFKNVPHYHRWFRFYQFWTTVEGRREFAAVQADWTEPGSISPQNADLRRTLIQHLMREYEGRPDLQSKVIPNYPPYGKRMLRDNGAWANALKQENVHLVTDGIERITATGVLTRDGVHHELDALVYCTGFRAFDFLSSIEVTGRDGADLHEQWGQEPTAYLGVTVPNFPNLFCLYGPNTNLVVNGSIVMFSECAVHYVLESIRLLLSGGHRSMDLKSDTLEEYQSVIDDANARMAWGVPGVSNWYKSPSGRVSQNWPLSTLEYWERTRRPEPEHYRIG
jgi:4-hydroxyacetophenone monooxygenase